MLQGQKIFLLGSYQFGTVNIKKRLAFFHRFTDKIHIQFFYPAVELGVNRINPGLIVGDVAECSNVFDQRFAFYLSQTNAHILNRHRIDTDGRSRLFFFTFFLVNRHQIHSHGRFPRLVSNIRRIHRRRPVFDLFTGFRINHSRFQSIFRSQGFCNRKVRFPGGICVETRTGDPYGQHTDQAKACDKG